MGRRILLIDDDADDRMMFCEALEEISPEIVCDASAMGLNAFTQLENKELETPDLIFLDVNMPAMSGWKCLSVLKEHDVYKYIPVIMYSTTSRPEDIDKAEQLGSLCFFTKPYNFKELKKNLAIVVRHLLSNSLSSIIQNSSLFVAPGTSS